MNNKVFSSFCLNALSVRSLYMWGTYGKKITENLISSKKKQYPNRYSESRLSLLRKNIDGETVGCDCTGLIKWALWTNGDLDAPIRYNAATDRGTGGLYREAKEKGIISTLPELPGTVVYKEGHVGVYIGDGNVIECTLGSRGDGIVKTKIHDTKWTHWLKVPEIDYIETTREPDILPADKPLHKTLTDNQKKISFLKKLKRIILKN